MVQDRGLSLNEVVSMRKQFQLCLALTWFELAGLTALASPDFGTPQEAAAMLARAIGEIKADKLNAIARFNSNDAHFRDRDLFVFCFNRDDGQVTAHEALVGRNVRTLRDASGKAFGEEMHRQAREGQVSEVTFVSPVPGKVEQAIRRSYVTAVGDQVCGVSSYVFEASKPTQ